MTSILVTGGCGNIGSALVAALLKDANNHVVVADNLLTGDRKKIDESDASLTLIKCDVNDYDDLAALFYRYQFDLAFHLSAVVGVQRTLDHPLWVLRDIRGIENLLKLAKSTGVQRVFYASSSEVYGEPFEFPQNEQTTPLNSRLPYAVVKNLGEVYFRTYQREYDLDYTIFRYFNTYGPNQSEDFVLPRFVRSALAGRPITIYGDGSQTRTFCYVDDNIDTCIAASRSTEHVNTVINVGSDHELSILQLAELVISLTGSSSEIEFLPALEEGDMSRRCPDNSVMKALLNRPLVTLEQGIERLVQHYQSEQG